MVKTTSIYYFTFPKSGVWAWLDWVLCSGSHRNEVSARATVSSEVWGLLRSYRGSNSASNGCRTEVPFSCWCLPAPGSCGQVLTIQPSHNTASFYEDSDLCNATQTWERGPIQPPRGDYSGMGILGASLGFWTLLKKSGPQLDMIFQILIFMWVFFFFLNLLIINVLFNTSSFFFFFLIDTELCEKQPSVLTLCSDNRKIRGRGFEICRWHWPLLQFYRGMCA